MVHYQTIERLLKVASTGFRPSFLNFSHKPCNLNYFTPVKSPIKSAKDMRLVSLGIVSMWLLMGCSGEGFYHLDSEERGKQRGYHANEANRLLDANEKNRKTNQVAAEKHRQNMNAQAKAKTRKGVVNNREFNFY